MTTTTPTTGDALEDAAAALRDTTARLDRLITAAGRVCRARHDGTVALLLDELNDLEAALDAIPGASR